MEGEECWLLVLEVYKSTRFRWFDEAYHFQLVQVEEGGTARHSQDPPFQWKECSSVAA